MSNLVPENFNERMQYCEVLAKSNLIPKEFKGKPEDVLVAIFHRYNWSIENKTQLFLIKLTTIKNISVR